MSDSMPSGAPARRNVTADRFRTAVIVLAARNSGAPLLLWAVDASPSISLRNWDQTVIPKPYATINLSYGGPIYVPAHASREVCEEIRAKVDVQMAELQAISRRFSATS